jgi:hypothetical protein
VANYHFDDAAGVRGDAKFRRVPLEATAYYTGLDKLRVGGGLNYIVSPTVRVMVDGTAQSVRFSNAIGKTFELGYEVAPALWANLRLVSAKFKPKMPGNAEAADVTHLSVNLSYLF